MDAKQCPSYLLAKLTSFAPRIDAQQCPPVYRAFWQVLKKALIFGHKKGTPVLMGVPFRPPEWCLFYPAAPS